MPSRHPFQRFSKRSYAALLALSGGGLMLPLVGCGSGIIGSAVPASTPTTTVAPSAVQAGPQLGYIWSDKTQTLRPVLGVAGSSQLGASVVPADLYLTAASSAASNLAILQETDGVLDLMALPSGQPTRLAATLPTGVQIRFSPSGTVAIAFLRGATSVTLLSSLTGTPAATTVAFNAAISEAAVSDNKSVAAALGSSIRTLSATGTGNSATTVATLGGLAFNGTTDDLLVADATANSLTLVRNSVTAPALTVIQSANLLKSPQGVGASHDGRWAVLANSGDANIIRVDLTSQTAPQSFPCSCQPALIAQLSGQGVFRVTAADSGPAWMLDASAATPRVLFIPASTAASGSSQP